MNSHTNKQTTDVKHIVRLGLTLLLLVSTRAGASYTLSVTADRPDAIYQQGETVTFTIKLQLDQQPVDGADVSWMITKDGVPPTTRGTVKLAGGSATVTGKLNEPGFLLCRATFAEPNEHSRFALGGAAIDPLQIKPSLPAPADFDEFWTAQKKKLAAVPVNPRLTPVESPVKGVDCFDLQADCVGAPVSGYFAKPTVRSRSVCRSSSPSTAGSAQFQPRRSGGLGTGRIPGTRHQCPRHPQRQAGGVLYQPRGRRAKGLPGPRSRVPRDHLFPGHVSAAGPRARFPDRAARVGRPHRHRAWQQPGRLPVPGRRRTRPARDVLCGGRARRAATTPASRQAASAAGRSSSPPGKRRRRMSSKPSATTTR